MPSARADVTPRVSSPGEQPRTRKARRPTPQLARFILLPHLSFTSLLSWMF